MIDVDILYTVKSVPTCIKHMNRKYRKISESISFAYRCCNSVSVIYYILEHLKNVITKLVIHISYSHHYFSKFFFLILH